MPSPHVDDEKGKKAMIYNARKDRRREIGRKEQKNRNRKIISLGRVRRGFMATYHVRTLDLFTLKPNILAQDQTSFHSRPL